MIEEHRKPWTIRNVRTKQANYWAAQNRLEYYQRVYDNTALQLEITREYYQKALQVQPDNIYALNGLGRVAATQEYPDEALAYYQDAVAKNPTSPTALNALGKYYNDTAHPEEAFAQYQISLRYSPNNVGAFYGLTKSYNLRGDLSAVDSAQALEFSLVWWPFYMDVARP